MKTSTAINAVRDCLQAAFGADGWKLQGADSALSAWNALATPGRLGTIVAVWTGETPVEQAADSLVADLAFSVWILGRRHEQDNAARRQAQSPADLAVSEAHDRAKAALLALDMSALGAGPQDVCPVYQGCSQLATPDGLPLDGIEQRWTVRMGAEEEPA